MLEVGPRVLRLRFRRGPGGDGRGRVQYTRWSATGRFSPTSYTGSDGGDDLPLIGNYGTADEDYETKFPTIGGMIVREYNDLPSNLPLHEDAQRKVLEGAQHSCHLGHRHLDADAHHPRRGSQKVIVTDASTPREEILARLQAYAMPHDMVFARELPQAVVLAYAQPTSGMSWSTAASSTTSSASSTKKAAT